MLKYTKGADLLSDWTWVDFCMHAHGHARHLQGVNQLPGSTDLALSGSWWWERRGGGVGGSLCFAMLLWASDVWGLWFSLKTQLMHGDSGSSWGCCTEPSQRSRRRVFLHKQTEQTVIFRYSSSGNRMRSDKIYFGAACFMATSRLCFLLCYNSLSKDRGIIKSSFFFFSKLVCRCPL